MIKQETIRFKKKYFFQMASSGMSCIYNNGYIQLKWEVIEKDKIHIKPWSIINKFWINSKLWIIISKNFGNNKILKLDRAKKYNKINWSIELTVILKLRFKNWKPLNVKAKNCKTKKMNFKNKIWIDNKNFDKVKQNYNYT